METLTVWKDVREGDVVITQWDPRRTRRTVKRLNPARARGYIIIDFEDGTRTSYNDTNAVLVVRE